MLTYAELKEKPRKLVSLTSLTPDEFEILLPAFGRAYQRRHPASQTKTGKARKRKAGAGRKGLLANIEEKLLFALVYQKSYPLQSVMGELFGMGQSQANEWIHELLPILKQALDDLGYAPERDPKKFKQQEQDRKDAVDSIIDGTERRRQRPKKAEKQALHYSGKKKMHSDKNVVIVHTRSKRVGYLSPTYSGKTHDKKIADEEQITYPRQTVLHKDTGFQGYEPKVQQTQQPKKTARQRPDPARETTQSCVVTCACQSRTRHQRHQAFTVRERHAPQYTSRVLRWFHGNSHRLAQFACASSQAFSAAMRRKSYFL